MFHGHQCLSKFQNGLSEAVLDNEGLRRERQSLDPANHDAVSPGQQGAVGVPGQVVAGR